MARRIGQGNTSEFLNSQVSWLFEWREFVFAPRIVMAGLSEVELFGITKPRSELS